MFAIFTQPDSLTIHRKMGNRPVLGSTAISGSQWRALNIFTESRELIDACRGLGAAGTASNPSLPFRVDYLLCLGAHVAT